MQSSDTDFPHTLTISIPFPTHRLANSALRVISVDQELSPLVRRSFSLTSPDSSSTTSCIPSTHAANGDSHSSFPADKAPEQQKTVLQTHYSATTARMLRVAVNGFFETVGVVIGVMQELDTDVLHEVGIEGLEGAQGVEWGMTGTGTGTGGSTKIEGAERGGKG